MSADELPPAVEAFNAVAPRFDARFGEWHSVAAQRRAVRRVLERIFPPGSRLLELGAGTAEDALYMLGRGYRVTVTDGAPAMVERARAKLEAAGHRGVPAERAVLEDLAAFASSDLVRDEGPYDGAYSNFAALNCVADLRVLAEPLGRLIRPGGACALVMFGRWSPGDVIVELLRGRPRSALRRFGGGPAPARLGGRSFTVWYPSTRAVQHALRPWFRLRATHGIGVLVPPSGAEPFISRFPALLRVLELGDRALSHPLAALGDHVLIHLERTERAIP